MPTFDGDATLLDRPRTESDTPPYRDSLDTYGALPSTLRHGAMEPPCRLEVEAELPREAEPVRRS